MYLCSHSSNLYSIVYYKLYYNNYISARLYEAMYMYVYLGSTSYYINYDIFSHFSLHAFNKRTDCSLNYFYSVECRAL